MSGARCLLPEAADLREDERRYQDDEDDRSKRERAVDRVDDACSVDSTGRLGECVKDLVKHQDPDDEGDCGSHHPVERCALRMPTRYGVASTGCSSHALTDAVKPLKANHVSITYRHNIAMRPIFYVNIGR